MHDREAPGSFPCQTARASPDPHRTRPCTGDHACDARDTSDVGLVAATPGEWYGRLAESFTVVHYDRRGAGLSQREVRDCQSRRMGLTCASSSTNSRSTCSHFSHNTEHVSRRVLWNAVYRFADFTNTRLQQALNLLLEDDFELFTEMVAYAGQGWPEPHRARQFAEYMPASIRSRTLLDALSVGKPCQRWRISTRGTRGGRARASFGRWVQLASGCRAQPSGRETERCVP
jgi:hypothetical protein